MLAIVRRYEDARQVLVRSQFSLHAIQEAKKLGDEAFKASQRWVSSFCRRNSVRFASQHGTNESADAGAAAAFTVVAPAVVDAYGMDATYNIDESLLKYRQ